MPALASAIAAGLSAQTHWTTFIVELQTSTVRRWTNYRGRTATGARGVVVSSVFYATKDLQIPQIEETSAIAPLSVTVTIGNSDNASTDLATNGANVRKRIIITKVHFEADGVTVRGTEPWFEGLVGKPGFRGEFVTLDCHADMGRRGKTPKTKSRGLMTAHASPPAGWKITVRS